MQGHIYREVIFLHFCYFKDSSLNLIKVLKSEMLEKDEEISILKQEFQVNKYQTIEKECLLKESL